MSNEVKKYNWFYSDRVQYTLEEYLYKLNELISSPISQMQECNGDLFMSEYQKLIEGACAFDRLINQLKEDRNV
jgi:hypothetical protein